MKKSLYLFLVLLTASFSFLCGCSDDEEIGPDDVSDIVSGLIFATGVDTQTITFTTNKKWVATVSSLQGDASWCSISPSSGAAGTANIRVSTTDNAGHDERSATITIKTGNTQEAVNITQHGKKGVARTVQVDSPGTLKDLLGSDYRNIEELTITGKIHGDDLSTIRQISRLHYLDISEVFIVKGGAHYETIANTISSSMFADHSYLRTIILPNTVNSIQSSAFSHSTGLTSITIPNSVTSIEGGVFYGCKNLKNILVSPDNVSYADIDGVLTSKDKTVLINFPYGKSNKYTIPNSVTTIGKSAFSGCDGLTSVTIPNSVTSIGDYAFSHCTGLTSITIPNNVTSIGEFVFFYCSSLTSITIPNSVTTIGKYAFSSCDGLTSITISNSVTSIGDYTFSYCTGLTSITIPNNVTSIGADAFRGCSGLTSVVIGSGIKSIGGSSIYGYYSEGSFAYCNKIEELYIKATNPPNGYSGIPYKSSVILYVPKGSKEKYQNSRYWEGFYQYIEE